jgi:hypothetical protein
MFLLEQLAIKKREMDMEQPSKVDGGIDRNVEPLIQVGSGLLQAWCQNDVSVIFSEASNFHQGTI